MSQNPMSLRGRSCPKQSPRKRGTLIDGQSPFNWRLLRREEHPPRNDIVVLILLFSILLTACNQTINGATPTPLFADLAATQSGLQAEALTPTLAPFRFDLPTPGVEPVSGWRPPLYPVPWAMSAYDHFYFARPIAADQVNWPLADYRYGGIFSPPAVHTGEDIDAPDGTPILAAGPGTVVWAGWGLFTQDAGNLEDDYGQAVAIRHDFGYKGQKLYTVYAHMSQVTAILGQHVETGEQIGLVGSTGRSTGPHLHFEVRLGENTFFNTYNPELWTAPPQGWGVLVGRLLDKDGNTLNQMEILVRNEKTNEVRLIKTYSGGGAINHDPYFNENLVLSDLPAGLYKITFRFEKNEQYWLDILPGQVTYLTYQSDQGFSLGLPPAPTLESIPETATPQPKKTPTP
jgi:murein DD-endopeptidase MepM/ murein hydrolase activator NlpD